MGLPIVLKPPYIDVGVIVGGLRREYSSMYYGDPTPEQLSAWRSSLDAFLSAIHRVGEPYPVLAEYPIFDLERADFLVVGRRRAMVVECKGWSNPKRVNDYSVEVDGGLSADPCYQLKNYVNKLRYFHSAASKLEFDGVVYTYRTHAYHDDCRVVSDSEELAACLGGLGEPGGDEEVRELLEGRMVINDSLVKLVEKHKNQLIRGAAKILLDEGYGLSSEQLEVVERVLGSLAKREKKTYLVRGVSGSGKTLVALTLLLEAVSRGYKALLGYKNNRLLNTLRTALRTSVKGVDPSALIVFYSTGPQAGFRGLGEQNFPADKYGEIDLAIYDEAQRMTEDVIELSSRRANVTVYFYDDQQLLVGNEAGTRTNFLKYLEHPQEITLSAPFRAPKSYVDSLRSLLEGGSFTPGDYDFEVFDDILSMLDALRGKANSGAKVALICAFTESDGDRKNPKSPKNLRIGYPLQSGFDLYKGLNLEVRWLMDEKNQYPKYWMGALDPLEYCASVYGAQGLEADYVGVVWGRDLILREEGWTVNPEAITDTVGGKHSLKTIAKQDTQKAVELLKNRYYVMLSRGIRGTYVFFEDPETLHQIRRRQLQPKP